MARGREDKVDEELLAQMESGDGSTRIRVPLPNRKVNEMFAIADQMLGGRRVRAICEDGEVRISRIPGKMRRRQWVREEDLIVVQPWEYQDDRANVITRYSKTQAMYLSRKGQLPPIVDVFGSGEESIEIGDESGIFESSSEVDEIESEQEDDVDDMFSSNDSDEELTPETEPIAEPTRTRHDDFEDDDDGDIDSFFG
ncbi:MAG: translation initiation factor eIF-1A [Candidatus Thermoplasmatota archaeon]|nr:translation initiation factor eIF-1A [Candidatus Thermoplasmatota archaeon]|tara:strand:+ start:1401 stop:1994 length:594 start_codon:yes stop_codon:yes gene_type:complete